VAQIAIVGDFDEAAATARIKELLAGWKSKVPYERVTSEFATSRPSSARSDTPDKENAVLIARQNVEHARRRRGLSARSPLPTTSSAATPASTRAS
jgi:hypothetical protein